jgi:hypothetical protein
MNLWKKDDWIYVALFLTIFGVQCDWKLLFKLGKIYDFINLIILVLPQLISTCPVFFIFKKCENSLSEFSIINLIYEFIVLEFEKCIIIKRNFDEN